MPEEVRNPFLSSGYRRFSLEKNERLVFLKKITSHRENNHQKTKKISSFINISEIISEPHKVGTNSMQSLTSIIARRQNSTSLFARRQNSTSLFSHRQNSASLFARRQNSKSLFARRQNSTSLFARRQNSTSLFAGVSVTVSRTPKRTR